jgi:hypothetical protein
MSLLSALVCAGAAWRLRNTPLFGAALATAAVNAGALIWAVVMSSRREQPSRPMTALKHVSAALGGFFLFVSFSL